ncbi:MAG: ABC transporter permease [Lentisphaerae bacterium]|nr:ABC transporter permease [Lentisphaerota bacterium]
MPVRLMMTSCQSSTDVIALHGVDKRLVRRFRNFDVAPGEWEEFAADTSGALVGAKIARRYGWRPGEHVTLQELEGVSFTVRGIVQPRGSADDFLIYVDRSFLQQIEDELGLSHYVLVKAAPGVDAAALCRAIAEMPFTVQVTAQPEEALVTTILDQLADLVRLSRAVVGIVIVVLLIAVGNAISMATRDRFREFGVLRTLGFPRRAVAFMVIGEGTLQGLVGALAGCLVVQGLAWAGLIRSVATCAMTVDFLVGPRPWAVSLAVVTLAAALGCLLPAWSASRVDILRALRPEE